MQCMISSDEALEELPPKDWTMGRIQIWVIGHSTRDHETTPFLRREDEHVKERGKKPTEEKVGQEKPQQGKDLTLPLHGACLEECPQPHSQITALQIHCELAVVAQCTTKALKVHTASHLQHVFNGAGGAHAAIGCLQRAQLAW